MHGVHELSRGDLCCHETADSGRFNRHACRSRDACKRIGCISRDSNVDCEVRRGKWSRGKKREWAHTSDFDGGPRGFDHFVVNDGHPHLNRSQAEANGEGSSESL